MNPFTFTIEEVIQPTIISIFQGNELVQQNQVIAPLPFLEQRFKQLCVQLKRTGQPMKVRMSQQRWVEGRDTPIEVWIEYQTWKDDE